MMYDIENRGLVTKREDFASFLGHQLPSNRTLSSTYVIKKAKSNKEKAKKVTKLNKMEDKNIFIKPIKAQIAKN